MSFAYFRISGRIFRRSLGLVAAAALATACAASSPVPPERDPYFPASLAVSPDSRFLFVANANSDLKYGAGSLQVYGVDTLVQMVTGWAGGTGQPPAGCTADPVHRELARCPSTVSGKRAAYVLTGAAQIGNFAAQLRLQQLDGGALRLFSTVRGDPSVTWVDFDPATTKLSCGDNGASFPICDDAHRIRAYRDAPEREAIPAEPFGLAVDGAREHAVITHLTNGDVSLLRVPKDPAQKPTLEDTLTGIWSPINTSNPLLLLTAVGVSPRLPGDERDLFYVTSRSEARINVLRAVDTVGAGGVPAARLVRDTSFFYAPAPAGNGTIGDARGITFSSDGTQSFVVSRTPNSLMIFDTSIDENGLLVNQMTGQVELCPRPNDVAVVESTDLDGPRVYVPCFDTGEVWVVDTDHAQVEARVTVGLGPEAIAVIPDKKLAFVANYGDDTISVIDIDPASPAYEHTVLQLGKLRGDN